MQKQNTPSLILIHWFIKIFVALIEGVFMFKKKISSQKCEKIENIRRFFVILFVYVKDFQ